MSSSFVAFGTLSSYNQSLMMDLERKYTIDDVADMLNVTKETVRRWCRDRKIEYVKLPGAKGEYRFSKEGIRNFIAKLNTEPIELPKKK